MLGCMRPYLDSGFLATLILNAVGSPVAWSLIRGFEPPYQINQLHVLQIEGMLFKTQVAPDATERMAAARGMQAWHRYLEEEVFKVREEAWEVALRLAVTTSRAGKQESISPLFHLHAALAVVGDGTHFLSFRPEVRALAGSLGLTILPERL